MEDLRDKVAVITGAASGIGRAVATRAASEGMRVVLADIEEAPLEEVEAALSNDGADVVSAVTDVSDAVSVRELREVALRRFGAVHLVHNNAGIGAGGLVWEVPEETWKWIFGVNLWGVVHGISTFVPLLVEQGEGHVVNTASIAGLTSAPFMGPYNATKHAVVTISETLYKDLQVVGSPVGVSVLCPGFVQTRIAESERNRPDWVPSRPAANGPEMRGVLQSLVDGGIPARTVADAVMDGVRANRFYILTHPGLTSGIETRLRDVLEGRSPSPTMIA
ncbi:MAG TPA: SDR family NAD(P)-dependent oxidoreductase [Acidimicrobiales bacterium]|nr:SDR family NAD(P)-dependent oxidoreductase [Acidimicrobiales bacterium]